MSLSSGIVESRQLPSGGKTPAMTVEPFSWTRAVFVRDVMFSIVLGLYMLGVSGGSRVGVVLAALFVVMLFVWRIRFDDPFQDPEQAPLFLLVPGAAAVAGYLLWSASAAFATGFLRLLVGFCFS